MKKDWNSISQNMTLQGLMWKLGSFFSLLFIFTSASLFASETCVHTNTVGKSLEADPSEKSVVYIAEGTVLYGLENISKNTEIKHFVKKRDIQKRISKKSRSITGIKKTTQKVKQQQTYNNPEISSHISSSESKNSFEVSKHQFVMGALAFNHIFKAITVDFNYAILLKPLSNAIVIHKYAFSFTSNTMHAHSFTRPPPFI